MAGVDTQSFWLWRGLWSDSGADGHLGFVPQEVRVVGERSGDSHALDILTMWPDVKDMGLSKFTQPIQRESGV